MALTDLQRRVLRAIARNRSPDSHIAGGSALMRNTGRVSADIDVFHDASEAVVRSAESDIATLIGEGLSVAEVSPRGQGVMEAVITDDQGVSVVIQWAEDFGIQVLPGSQRRCLRLSTARPGSGGEQGTGDGGEARTARLL